MYIKYCERLDLDIRQMNHKNYEDSHRSDMNSYIGTQKPL
jgi:hypothetical protein